MVFEYLEQRTGVTPPIVVSYILLMTFCSTISLTRILSNLDYKIYEQVVEATHRFKGIFYDAE